MSGASLEIKMKLLTMIVADATLSAAAKAVAVPLLVVFHNNQTGRCNPSYDAIAAATGRCRRAVIPSVLELRKAGWIEIDTTGGGGRGNTNKISFMFDRAERVKDPASIMAEKTVQTSSPLGRERVKPTARVKCSARVKSNVKKGEAHRTRTTEEPLILNLTIEEGKTRARKQLNARDLGFDEFYGACPKRVGQKDAEKEYVKALKSGASPTQLLESMKRYAAECVDKSPTYIKEPKNWLRGGHWLDEPATDSPRQSRNPRDRLSAAQEMARAGGWGGSHE